MMAAEHAPAPQHSYSSSRPLHPLPASFTRAPAPGCVAGATYAPFPAFHLPGRGKRVMSGFQTHYPARIMADHDISAADWDRFLADIRAVGSMRAGDYALAFLLLFPLGPITIFGGFFITPAVLHALRQQYIPDVLALVELYQHRVFGPRGLDVCIACGAARLTGYFPGDESYLDAPPIAAGTLANAGILADAGRLDDAGALADTRADTHPGKHSGAAVARRGRCRLVVQPLTSEPPEPTPAAVAHMASLERRWGCRADALTGATAPITQ